MPRALASVAIAGLAAAASLASAAVDPLEDYLRAEMAARGIPGLAFVVVEEGRVSRQGHLGLANVEVEAPVEETSVFAIASLDKQLTAAGLMRLVEAGKLGVDDEARKWVEVPWAGVTLRHLLSHTSGLPDEVAFPVAGRSWTDYTTADELAHVRGLVPAAPPGVAYLYSDANLFLAQLATEKAAGEPWRDFIRREVFERAGMSGATFMDPLAILPGRVAAYTLDDDGRLRRDRRLEIDYGPLYNDLGMTIGDFGRWLEALGDDRVLSRASREAMWTPQPLAGGAPHAEVWQWHRYGLAFGLDEIAGRRVVTHSGHSGVGFLYLPDERFGVAVFTNLEHGAGSDPVGLALGVAARLRPELDLARRAAVADPDAARTTRLRRIYESLLAGEPDLGSFTPAARSAAWEGAGSLAGRSRRLGPLVEVVYLGEDPSSDGTRLVFRAEHERGRLLLRVALDPAGPVRTLLWSHP